MKRGIVSTVAAMAASAVGAARPKAEKAGKKAKPVTGPGKGVKLAAARLEAHRKAQAARLADADKAPIKVSRQARRRMERRGRKMPVGMMQAEWHRKLGLAVSRKMQARAARGVG